MNRLAIAAISLVVAALAGCGSSFAGNDTGASASGVASASAVSTSSDTPCTTRSCIVQDAKQTLIGGVAKDDSVMTALTCKEPSVKHAAAGVWTVRCTATYSDESKYAGIASVLISQGKVTWEPTSVVSEGNSGG